MAKNTQLHDNATVKISYSFKKIMTGSDLSRRRLPFMSAVSDNPGPVLWLTACGHGDEICGIVIIQEIFKKIQRKLLNGAVYAFPLMNPIGFETASRNITVSREDLNRSFPGAMTGTLGEIIANSIFSSIMETSPTLVLDLHNDWIKSIPYTLIDSNPGGSHRTVYKKTLEYARQAGFVSIVDTEKMTGTLSYNLLMNDIPVLTFELGESYVINEQNVEYGLKAVWNILAFLKMTKPIKEHFSYPTLPAYRAGKLLRYSDKPYSTKSGIIRFMAKPGDVVTKGKPIARIVNAFGKHQETIRALEDSIVLGHSDSSVVFPGMHIMAFGIP
ncbi:MAG: succinylglutamate desuccinylase/aspartoacylase family protein [Candidatus Latescibacteria bacterium]|nr:succinylglutamate desuccinylase/aspartoacylase family protein [Candidatus Latescibacterota bacterium]